MQIRATRLTAIASTIRRMFSPASLFAAGEQGAWYDPSDFDRYMQPVGEELVTNGDFSNGTTGWSSIVGTHSVVSGKLRCTSSGANIAFDAAPIPTTVGKTYRLTVDAFAGTGTSRVIVGPSPGNGSNFSEAAGSAQASRTLVCTFVATDATTFVSTIQSTAIDGLYAEFDNISVRELTAIGTATLFQDAAGTTPVTAVEQFVGLMLDKSKGLVLGSELNAANYTNWTATGFTYSTGILSYTNGGGATAYPQTNLFPTLTSYLRISIYVTAITGAVQIANQGGTQSANLALGQNTCTLKCGSDLKLLFVFPVGSSVSINAFSVKELPGNHASQPTSTARPRLSARVNLTLASEVFVASSEPDNSVLLNNQGLISPRGDLTASKVSFASNGRRYRQDFITNPSGQAFKHSVWLRSDTPTVVGLRVASLAVAEDAFISCNVSNVWQQFTVSRAFAISGTAVRFGLDNRLGFGGGGVACEIEVWGADLRVANTGINLPPYQRVNNSTDYDTVGFPRYLAFDGVDDFMSTGNINFTGTDKMTVWAGVRKIANGGMILEATADASANNGAIWLYNGTPSYEYASRGSIFVNTAATPYAPPTTNVVTGISSISTDVATIRINGVQAASSTADQGTGNYGNYPMFIGSRAGTSLRFNGHLYSLIIRGAATNAAQLSNTDAWVNTRTGAY